MKKSFPNWLHMYDYSHMLKLFRNAGYTHTLCHPLFVNGFALRDLVAWRDFDTTVKKISNMSPLFKLALNPFLQDELPER